MHKKGQRKQSEDSSQKRARKKLEKMLQGIFVMAPRHGEGFRIRVTKLNRGRTLRDASTSHRRRKTLGREFGRRCASCAWVPKVVVLTFSINRILFYFIKASLSGLWRTTTLRRFYEVLGVLLNLFSFQSFWWFMTIIWLIFRLWIDKYPSFRVEAIWCNLLNLLLGYYYYHMNLSYVLVYVFHAWSP